MNSKQIILVCGFLLAAAIAGVQSQELESVKCDDGKYGYRDKNTGKMVVPCKYDFAYSFYYGVELACVRLNGKYGFIDKTGKEAIPLQYDNANPFKEGLAAVKLDGKCGFIDNTGKVVIPFVFDDANSFSKGLAAVKSDSKYGYIVKSGKLVIPYQNFTWASEFSSSHTATVELDGKWGVIDINGDIVVPVVYSSQDALYNSDDHKNRGQITNERNLSGAYNSVLSLIKEADEQFNQRTPAPEIKTENQISANTVKNETTTSSSSQTAVQSSSFNAQTEQTNAA